MAIQELRPLKLGIKGPSHWSRLGGGLRASPNQHSSVSFGHQDEIWNTEVSLYGSSICCGSVEGHISSSLQSWKGKSALQHLLTERVSGAAEESLCCLPAKTGLHHFLEYEIAYVTAPQSNRPCDRLWESINHWGDSHTAPYRFSCECQACPPDWSAAAAS